MIKAELLAKERREVEQLVLYDFLPAATLTYVSKNAEAVVTFSTEIRFPKEMLIWPKSEKPEPKPESEH